MLRQVFILAGSFAPGVALACSGLAYGDADVECEDASHVAHDPDPAHSARRAALIGPANCSWTTKMMAARVLKDGEPFSYTGHLHPSDNHLPSKVAAPFTIGAEEDIYVVANELLDVAAQRDVLALPLSIRGKLLEADGFTYFVTTAYTLDDE